MKTINGKKNNISDDSAPNAGIKAVNGKRYLFDENGTVLTGIQTVYGRKYYFGKDGSMQTGLIEIDGKKYYFDPSGVMQTGFRIVGGEKRYFLEDGSMEEGVWADIDGKTCYYDSDGNMRKDGIFDIMGGKYLFDESGALQTGWQEIDGGYYLFDRQDGKMQCDCTADGVTLGEDGKAVLTEYTKSKIETMMNARSIMMEQTEPTDSMEEKRLKCFNWVLSLPYHRFRLLSDCYEQEGWEVTFANDIFVQQRGCCVSESAAVAFLFREIGYTDVAVCHDTSHAWVFIGDKLYDPVFAEGKSFEENYDVLPYDYRKDPVGMSYIDGEQEQEDNTEENL